MWNVTPKREMKDMCGGASAGQGVAAGWCFVMNLYPNQTLSPSSTRQQRDIQTISPAHLHLLLHLHLSMIHSAAAARDVDVSIQFGYSAPPTAGVKMACSNVFHFYF